MKKKLISILLLVVIFATLIPIAAFAEPAVAIYTLSSGDTVYSLCQRHGVDYDKYKVLVMALNGVSNENDFGKMPVGSKIAVPVSANAAATLAGIGSSGVISGSTGSGNTGTAAPAVSPTPAVGVAKDVIWGDTVSCYVISYTVKAGDTIIGIYKSRDLNYKTFSNLILRLNKISNFNSLRVGQKLLLPVDKIIAGDNVVYTLMSHPMKSGETVYNVVNSGYGLNYRVNEEMLMTINGKDNLGSFKVGEVLHIAVAGYLQAPTTADPETAASAVTPVTPVNTAIPASSGITVIK